MKKKEDKNNYIYMLGIRFTKPGLYCVQSDEKGFNEYRFYDGKLIEDWPEGIEFIFDGGPEEDFILGGLHWMLVSEHARQVFIRLEIPGIQFLPVKVIHNKTNEEIGPYWVMNVTQSVKRLTWNFIDDLDIFRRRTDTFISSRLKRLLAQQKADRGASFTRMPSDLLNRDETPE